jgi:uncharacterized MAPEG superfamily protein
MTIELWMLVWAVVLTFVQMLIAVQGATIQVGLTRLAGNREDMPALSGWKGRADRSYRNMQEYLLLFAALVLVAHVANAAGSLSALGAQIFLYARVVYAVVYLIGVPWLRTGVWAVSVVGMVLIAVSIFQAPSVA